MNHNIVRAVKQMDDYTAKLLKPKIKNFKN